MTPRLRTRTRVPTCSSRFGSEPKVNAMEAALESIQAAYRTYDREMTVSNFKVACVLGMILMPAGFALDYFVYPDLVWEFFKLRLLSSVLIGLFLALLLTRLGRKYYRVLGVTLLLIPSSFISIMI